MENFIPITLVLLLFIPIAFGLTREFAPVERTTLIKILFLALLARLALALFIDLFLPPGFFGVDSVAYMLDGKALADYWSGKTQQLYLIKMSLGARSSGYYYFIAYQYYLIGFIKSTPAYVNGLVGVTTILILAKLASRFFAWRIVRTMTLLMSFFPSLILFNAYVLKDTMVLFFVAISLFGYVEYLRARRWTSLLLSVSVFVPLYTFRFYMVFLLLGVYLFSTFLMAGTFSLQRVARSLAAGTVVFLAASFFGVGSEAAETFQKEATVQRMNYYQDVLKTGQSAAFEEQEYRTGFDLVKYFPVRMAHFLFAPFPWQITSIVSLMAFLELPFWWYLFPFSVRGFLFLLSDRRTRVYLPLLLFAVFVSVFYAMIESNIGTIYRKKAQVMPYLYLMSAVGLALAQARKKGVSTEYLLAPELRFRRE